MSLVAYTITALERDTADADASGKQVIVGATCSMFIQPANTVVQLFDDAAGSNGSTAKTTGSNGQVTVYVDPGVYRVSVNGSDSFVTIANDEDAVFNSVGIGTASPAGKLGIAGAASDDWSAGSEGGLVLNGSSALNSISTISTFSDTTSLRIGAGVTQKTGLFINGQTASGGSLVSVSTGGAERMRIDVSGTILPGANGTQDLGSTSLRFDTLFATNGTINTSDVNEKQDIESLNAAETRVAQSCKLLLRKFRWIDMAEEKGDDARIHFGIIAQDLQQAFADEGLDAGRYAMFTSDTWTDENTGEETTRMGVRYTELLAFIIAGL